MKNIGRVILELRMRQSMSRERLSENICSEKYIYFIETGRRDPSANMMDMLSNRLGEDLYEYIPYMDCSRPIFVKSQMEAIEKLRHSRNFSELNDLSKSLVNDVDFCAGAWKYELQYNELIYLAFVQNEFAHVIEKSQIAINEIKARYEHKDASEIITPTLARLYNILTMSLLNIGETNKSFEMLEKLSLGLARVRKLRRYVEMYISVTLNYIYLLIEKEHYTEACTIGQDLIDYQLETGNFKRLHISFFLNATAHHKLGNRNETLKLTRKVLELGLALEFFEDLRDILEHEYIEDFYRSGQLTVNLYDAFLNTLF